MLLSNYLVGIFSVLKNAWAPILLGLIINVLIEIFIPKKLILSGFHKKDFLTIIRASFSGLLISGLSFGVIPLIVSLRKNGASFPACAAMLAFTPWTGALGLMIVGSYVGFWNLMILLGCSFLLSIMVGLIISMLEKFNLLKSRAVIEKEYLSINKYHDFENYLSRKTGLKEISISISELLKNVFIAILFTAFFQLIFSNEFVSTYFSNNYSVLYAIPLATLIEIIGEGFSIFAGELYLLGANLGVVFSIIIAGVITDINELSMLDKIFSKKAATAYLLISLAGVVVFSYLLI
ncbi:MAG: permease [Candidatus Nanoarchaeia archaeon]